MKKFLIFLFSLCSLAGYAQEAVFSYGTDGQIIVDSTYIEFSPGNLESPFLLL